MADSQLPPAVAGKVPVLIDNPRHTADLAGPESKEVDVPHDFLPNTITVEKHCIGFMRMELVAASLLAHERFMIFASAFMLGLAWKVPPAGGSVSSLITQGTRRTYTGIATASFSQHSLLSTVNVLTSVFTAAGQPVAAKLCDWIGRWELAVLGVILYISGTVLASYSINVQTYCAGEVIFDLGYMCLTMALGIILADITSLRHRQLALFLPAYSGFITPWVYGSICEAFLADSTWQWGIRVWAIIVPVLACFLVGPIINCERRLQRDGRTIRRKPIVGGHKQRWVTAFFELDVVGILLLLAVLALFFTPMTLAGSESGKWQSASTVAPIATGLSLFPVFLWWEGRAPCPIMPMALWKDRGIWAALLMGMTKTITLDMTSTYLVPVIYVAFNQSIEKATTIAGLWEFTSTITGTLAGFGVVYFRRIKGFIVFGALLILVSVVLFIEYRGGLGAAMLAGVIAAECMAGFGNGFISYTAQVAVQARTRHEHLAIATSVYSVFFGIGGAAGGAVSGALWTTRMPKELAARISSTNLASNAFEDPYSTADMLPWGTPDRSGMVAAYQAVQLRLGTGLAFSLATIGFALLLRDTRLDHHRSSPDIEEKPEAPGLMRRLWI